MVTRSKTLGFGAGGVIGRGSENTTASNETRWTHILGCDGAIKQVS